MLSGTAPASPALMPQKTTSIAFVHRQRLQLIHDSRAHLHQPMPVLQQLPQIPILGTRYPDLREVIFQHQPQQESSILVVKLLLLHSLGLDFCRIAYPYLKPQLC